LRQAPFFVGNTEFAFSLSYRGGVGILQIISGASAEFEDVQIESNGWIVFDNKLRGLGKVDVGNPFHFKPSRWLKIEWQRSVSQPGASE
jgi:hypothetical protein